MALAKKHSCNLPKRNPKNCDDQLLKKKNCFKETAAGLTLLLTYRRSRATLPLT
jgi:hypothetical protein